MFFFRNYYVRCGCGHRNRPSKSPRETIRRILTGQLGTCRGCGKQLRCTLLDRTTPLIEAVRRELQAEGVTPVC